MKIDIPVLYEDDNMVVINKPAGLMVHSDGRSSEPTLVDWILEKYPEVEKIGEPIKTTEGSVIKRPGIVHRLDQDTTGAMVIAKSRRGFRNLKRQFRERTAKKNYRAFVYGEVKDDRGVIERPIGRSSSDFRRWSAQRGAKGKMREAITGYSVLARGEGFTFLEARPRTGRTHQIRVHLKAINHPIVADTLYAGKNARKKDLSLGFERMALHSHRLVLANVDERLVEVFASYPDDFKAARQKLGIEI